MSRGEITGAQVFKTFFILVSTGKVIGEAGSMTSDLAKGSTAVASVFAILDRRSLISNVSNIFSLFLRDSIFLGSHSLPLMVLHLTLI